jgi:hypothetical protein
VNCAWLFSLALGSAIAQAQVNPKDLVRQSIVNYEHDWQAAGMNWASTETDIKESEGRKEVDVSEVIPLAGTPYDRLIEKDGHPLSPSEQRKEERKLERAVRERERETPSEREERIRKYGEERAFINDIPEAYNFTLLGEAAVDGRPAWIVGMTPRPEFISSAPHGSMLKHIEGKLWIDKQDVRWAKAEARVIETIGIGWILARIERGTRFELEQTRVQNGLWAPRRITITGSALVMMVHSKPLNQELTWSGYKRSEYRKDESIAADKRRADHQSKPAGSKSFK